MIRINLLPIREIVKRKKLKNQIIGAFSALFFILCCFVIVNFFQLNTIQKLKDERASIDNEKQKYTKIIADIKKMDEEKQVLLKRIDVINQLKQSSSLTVHVLDEVANLTPPSRMWLKSLDQSGSQLSLKGTALDDQTIAKYMDELENSSYIQNVNLASSNMEIVADRNLKTFSITAQVAMPKN
jgi:type IV pilus assembly protein PilN